jgi:hypothetical protein
MNESAKHINFQRYAMLNNWQRSKLRKPIREDPEHDDPVIDAIRTNNTALWQKCSALQLVFPYHFYYVLSRPSLFSWFVQMMFTQSFHVGNEELVHTISAKNTDVLAWLIQRKYLADPRTISLYAVQLTQFDVLCWLMLNYGKSIIHDAVQLILVHLGCTNTLKEVIRVQGAHAAGISECIRLDIASTLELYFALGYDDPVAAYIHAVEHRATECIKWLRAEKGAAISEIMTRIPPPPTVQPNDEAEEDMWIGIDKV